MAEAVCEALTAVSVDALRDGTWRPDAGVERDHYNTADEVEALLSAIARL
jgi:hypothetical protein